MDATSNIDLSVKNRGGKLYAMGWAPVDGKRTRIRRSLGTTDITIANHLLVKIYEELSAKSDPRQKLGPVLQAYLDRPEARTKSQNYLLAHLIREYSDIAIEELTPAFIEKTFVVERKSTWSIGMSRRALQDIRAALNRAAEHGIIDTRVKIKLPREDDVSWRWLPEEQRDHFIMCCDLEIRPLAKFLFFTGARLGEALRVTWGDIIEDDDGRRVMLSNWKTRSRTRKMRAVPLRDDVYDMLLPKRHPTYVNCRVDGSSWPDSTLHYQWRQAVVKAGFERLTRHDARHTFASLLAMRNVSPRIIAELLGHSDMKMVMRYQHLTPSAGRDSIRDL